MEMEEMEWRWRKKVEMKLEERRKLHDKFPVD